MSGALDRIPGFIPPVPDEFDAESWERAYQRFETPDEERSKFLRRLRTLGVDALPRRLRIVELFCGRGNGLVALERLGFENLEGVDISARLLRAYRGRASLYRADCRRLPFLDGSRDVLIVQGGLHHLEVLPDGLHEVLREVGRVLRGGGRFVAVEPWRTPFLRLVHFVSARSLARRLSKRLDAFEEMFRLEKRTYEQWLSASKEILNGLESHFESERTVLSRGKLWFVGRKRAC
jgi:SAM-dependent methyltransferase